LGWFTLLGVLVLFEVLPFSHDAAQGAGEALAAELVLLGVAPDCLEVALFEVDDALDEVFGWHEVGLLRDYVRLV
jgi:hypothetical protein